MKQQTGELVNALHSVNLHVPTVATSLLAGTLPVAKQREFAGLLIELGNLLHRHADDSPSEPRHALRDEGDEHMRLTGTIDSSSVPDWLVLESNDGDDPPDR
ncbi:MAG: hypothetical protein JWQ81_6145 [Amycolatopsis sp.]|uniref:hypothetical protein n=1 Tax=Amycolatopsis sp. TaxID=37632 RepID=UPI00262AF7F4|nr:hypothetical protein [Amycolatopsis sp.]MCU1685406.1 hypothetical protein [Amycolatopsis sp.]